MKVGIDVSQIVHGTGVSDYTSNLVNSLLKVDHDNEYVLFGASLRKSDMIRAQFPQAKTFPIPPSALNLLWNYMHSVNIESFIGRVDIFHTSDWLEPPSSAPKVTTVHDLSPFLYPEEMSSGRLRDISGVHQAKMSWAIKESRRFICVSQSTAIDLARLFPKAENRITVIPEALPARFLLNPNPENQQRLKNKYRLKNYLLAIGTPQPRKNIARLVKSFLHYKNELRLPEKLVVIGGHGWGLADIPVHPDIIFTGYLSDQDLVDLLSGASALVYPSLHEGFGLPILLAFNYSIPVVTSQISSMPEVAGKAALLVDPLSIESIGEGIAAAMKTREKLIRLGKSQLRKFSWEETARKTLMVYSEVC